MVILLFAWIVLYLLPTQTDHRFAWTIEPTMTAMVMGAGYKFAIYFFIRLLTERRWHRVTLGFFPITVFTWMMLGATFLHWDRFHHGSLPFRLWFWYLPHHPRPRAGRVADEPGTRPTDARSPRCAVPAVDPRSDARHRRRHARDRGMAVPVAGERDRHLAVGVDATHRTPAASFVALPGVAWIAMAIDGRWSAARVMLTTVALGLVLLLIAVTRAWGEFDHGNPLSFIYVAGLVATLLKIGALGLWMRARARRPA